ncbi:protein NLP6 [Coffea arabica]|uniref:Protein NLP7-like n=1 Tax=Coffea arabica TaxID=13443 RepID=A0A6P6STD4_COFAR|nr:protein NLP7-like [Coffea arabica]XP_027069178.1 protein NLP7-like [Coffea arabica]
MEAQTSPSPPFITAGLGPCELSCSQLHSTILYDQQWVFWSAFCNDKVHCGKPRLVAAAATADGAVIKDQIKWILQLVMEAITRSRCLVQFWGLVKIGDKTYLTTCDQPFALRHYCFDGQALKKLCEYRKHCLEYLIPVDEDDDDHEIGPPGRVFRSGFPEFAWDVRDYTIREYPQRDYAVGRVRDYWALPIYHPTRHLPIGVLEIVSPFGFYSIRHRVLEKLQCPPREVNLTTTCVSPPAEANSCQDGEIGIIDEALSKVRQIRGLYYAESWTTSGEILCHRGVDFIRKGQGVVGRAFSSKSACFCRDVRQLSITEYPLVPNARHYGDSACFAVCLQSSCPNNCIYVLEFFLPTNEEDEDEDEADYRDPRTLLNSIMETLKEHLGSSFKIASGQELGQKLTVEVIKVSPEDEYSFEICSTTGIESQPRLEEAQGGDGMMQLDFSSQQVDTANAYINVQQSGIFGSPPRPEHEQGLVNISYQELNLAAVDVVHNSMNGIYEQQNGIVRSTTGQELVQNMVSIPHDEPIVEDPEREGAGIEQRDNEVTNLKMQKPSCPLKSELGITREVLEQNSARKLEDAAKNIGVSRSTLKRICREYGIHRWPPRKARKVNQAFAEQKIVQPSTEDTHEHHQSGATRLEDDNGMWVKAEYQGSMIKFRLPFSARKIDLEEKVAQRLNLEVGSFKIEYQDEDDDRILITCDEDLRTFMSSLSSLGRTTIKMYIV